MTVTILSVLVKQVVTSDFMAKTAENVQTTVLVNNVIFKQGIVLTVKMVLKVTCVMKYTDLIVTHTVVNIVNTDYVTIQQAIA